MDNRFRIHPRLTVFIVAFVLGALAASVRVTASPISPKEAPVLPPPVLPNPRQDAKALLSPKKESTVPIVHNPTQPESTRQKADPRAIEKAIVDLNLGPVGKTKVHHEHGNEQITLKPGNIADENLKNFTSLPPKTPEYSRLSNLRPVVRI